MWLVSFCVITLWGVTDDYQHSGRMALNLEVICSSKTLTTTYKTTQHHNTEDHKGKHHFGELDLHGRILLSGF
jgi:hypothetical protein